MAIIDKVCSCDIDRSFFYEEIHDTYTSWFVDYESLHNDMPKVEEYLKKYGYSEEVKLLKDNKIDYINLTTEV